MTTVDLSSIEPIHLIASMTFIITVAVVTATVVIRRAILRARRQNHTPEYWRMYARACSARCSDPAAAIDDPR